MHNDTLASDYLRRARSRLRALEVLMEERSWADVVREAQELVEIALKAFLRMWRIEVQRVHDVSPVLEQNRDSFPPDTRHQLEEMMRISRALRRDRELAFYESEDLTPSEFYKEEDAVVALKDARWIYAAVTSLAGAKAGESPDEGAKGTNGIV